MTLYAYLTVDVEEDSEDLTRCCRCHNIMKNPVWLPCSDTFCQSCLDESSACPTCGETFDTSSEGVRKYKDGFLSRLVERKCVSFGKDAEDLCELCKDLPIENFVAPLAEYYCMECDQCLCAQCKCRHLAGSYTARHTVVPSDEAFQHVKQSSPNCSSHRERRVSSLCRQCGTYFCESCQCEHANHETETVDEMLRNSRQHISDMLTRLKATTS